MKHIPPGTRSITIARIHLTNITSPSVPSVKRGDGSNAAAPVEEAVESKQKKLDRKNMVIKRLPTLEFQEFRKNGVDAGNLEELTGGGEWDKMAIITIHRRSAPKVRYPPYLGTPDFLIVGEKFAVILFVTMSSTLSRFVNIYPGLLYGGALALGP